MEAVNTIATEKNKTKHFERENGQLLSQLGATQTKMKAALVGRVELET